MSITSDAIVRMPAAAYAPTRLGKAKCGTLATSAAAALTDETDEVRVMVCALGAAAAAAATATVVLVANRPISPFGVSPAAAKGVGAFSLVPAVARAARPPPPPPPTPPPPPPAPPTPAEAMAANDGPATPAV